VDVDLLAHGVRRAVDRHRPVQVGPVPSLRGRPILDGWDRAIRPLAIQVVLQLPIADTGNGTPFLVKEYPEEGPTDEPKFIALGEDAELIVADVIAARGLGPNDFLFSAPDKPGGRLHVLGKGPQPKALEPEEWVPLRTDVWPDGYPPKAVSGLGARGPKWPLTRRFAARRTNCTTITASAAHLRGPWCASELAPSC
jgi:hypothetical protein